MGRTYRQWDYDIKLMYEATTHLCNLFTSGITLQEYAEGQRTLGQHHDKRECQICQHVVGILQSGEVSVESRPNHSGVRKLNKV